MASDAYIATYGSNNVTTEHLNSAGAISATMQYAVYDRRNATVLAIAADVATAQTQARPYLNSPALLNRVSIITVPK